MSVTSVARVCFQWILMLLNGAKMLDDVECVFLSVHPTFGRVPGFIQHFSLLDVGYRPHSTFQDIV